MDDNKSAFSGGTKVTFNTGGTYSSGPVKQQQNNVQNSNSTDYIAPKGNVNNTNTTSNSTNNYSQSSSFSNSNVPNNTSNINSSNINSANYNSTNSSTTSSTSTTTSTSNVPSHGPSPKSSNKKMFWFGILGGIISCAVCFLLVFALGGFGGVIIGSTGNQQINTADESEDLAEAVANKCLPSVVAINVYSSQQTGSLALASMGSGVIISKDGYVITNQHVIEGAEKIKVTVKGQECDADKVGEDSSSDIAVVKLKDAKDITPIELADSDKIKVGAWVMSIGNPFGLEQSVATGIISATSRSQVVSSQTDGSNKVYPNLIQTDAAINPGNSGGALVDKNGKLVGINALIQSNSGNYSGVGFAIPVNYAINLSKTIIDGKAPSHAYLGISMTNVDSKNSQQYGWSVSQGAYISGVVQGGPAEKAGMKVGDIVTKCEDDKIVTTSDLLLSVRKHNPGDTIKITFNRAGEDMTVDVTLGSDEGQDLQQKQKQQQNKNNRNGQIPDQDLDELWKYFFGY